MDESTRPVSTEPAASTPLPTAGQVLTRTMPAATVLALGWPLLTYWGLYGNGNERSSWLPFAPALLMIAALLVQHLVRPPRPRLDPRADQKALRRWMLLASSSGRTPEDPHARTAAGILACKQLETAALMLGTIAGVIAIWVISGETWWAVTAILLALIAVVPTLRARRGWHYLKALHAPARTG